jgi:16S rRNA G966 N2-methylase RsmD
MNYTSSKRIREVLYGQLSHDFNTKKIIDHFAGHDATTTL